MKLLIVGTGYVGLVTGACFAQMGHHVICLDIDKKKIKNLQNGIIPIYEPGLKEMVERNSKEKRLTFTTDYEKGVKNSDICFIGVPTPASDDGSCNLDYVKNAAKSIAEHMDCPKIIVNKSTVPIGTADMVTIIIEDTLREKNLAIEFDVVSNPEFLKEGSAISDCMKPDRIIIGTNNEKTKSLMKDLYSGFTLNHDRIICMDTLSAEMTKYAANAMLATRISFMNELSHICKFLGANINEVRKGIGSDKRIGYSFLYAGIGYGGSCFPKDVQALISQAKEKGYTPKLLDAVESINHEQKKVLYHKMEKYFEGKGGLTGKTIALWGLSFKPDTDDLRDAPSLILMKKLIEKGVKLKVYDPVSMEKAKHLFQNNDTVTFCTCEEDATENADAIALITEWKQFRRADLAPILSNMKGRGFFDGRNQYQPEEMKQKGFDYMCIGVPDSKHHD